MADNIKLNETNWEKISVYVTLTIAFLALCSQLFSIKDELKDLSIQVAKLEVKVEKLEKK